MVSILVGRVTTYETVNTIRFTLTVPNQNFVLRPLRGDFITFYVQNLL
jgi:hypothetical protein